MRRVLLLALVIVAGCATPMPPAPPDPLPATRIPAAARHERTVIETTTPIYGGLPAERAAVAPAGR